MKGSAITGPVGKEAAELWPVCSLSVRELCNVLTFRSVSPRMPVWLCRLSLQLYVTIQDRWQARGAWRIRELYVLKR